LSSVEYAGVGTIAPTAESEEDAESERASWKSVMVFFALTVPILPRDLDMMLGISARSSMSLKVERISRKSGPPIFVVRVYACSRTNIDLTESGTNESSRADESGDTRDRDRRAASAGNFSARLSTDACPPRAMTTFVGEAEPNR